MKGFVGRHSIEFLEPPRGERGEIRVRVGAEVRSARYVRDAGGLWLETPLGWRGFDVVGRIDESEGGGSRFTVHERGGDGEWRGLRFEREAERRAREMEQRSGASAGPKKVRVKSQMPGKIVKLLAAPGAKVGKGDALLVMEAMKMENEIRAPIAGEVKSILVSVGQAVESGAGLLEIDG